MKRESTRERGINPKKQKWCPVNCSPHSDQCPAHPRWAVGSSWPTSSVNILTMMLHGMEYPFGKFRSAVLTVLPPSFSCTCSLPECGKLKNPGFRVSTAQQQPKYQCVANIILILNPKQSTVPAARKKSNSSIPAESRTFYSYKLHFPYFSVWQKLGLSIGLLHFLEIIVKYIVQLRCYPSCRIHFSLQYWFIPCIERLSLGWENKFPLIAIQETSHRCFCIAFIQNVTGKKVKSITEHHACK